MKLLIGYRGLTAVLFCCFTCCAAMLDDCCLHDMHKGGVLDIPIFYIE